MSKYKCIIFDCDGVLVDSEVIANRVFVEMANELGINIDLDYAMKHFKGSFLKDCIKHISKLADVELPESFENDYRKRSFDAFKAEIKPVAGVADLLKKITIPFCVASSGPENKIRLNLEHTNLLHFFEGKIFSCHNIQKWKPEPDVFLWAAKTMGFNPKECLVIEDSLTGVIAAKRGGFDVFGYTAHDYNKELKTFSNRTFGNMNDLLEMI